MSDLKKKSLNALLWSFIDSFGVYFVRFGFSIAIARQLIPRDYGLSGMVAIFIALAAIITESGFSMALIQKKDSNQADYSTVFFFNLFVSFLLYGILFLTAGLIANFYNEPIIKDITRIAALSVITSALITVQVTILNKEMNFKLPALIRMIAAVISGIIGVILAYNGFGVWALVYPTLIGSIISVILFWFFNRWRPDFIFSRTSFKSLYKYGINIFAQGFTSIILDQIYYPLIGKFYSASELGYFSYANKFYQIFVRRITVSYGRVAFPAFSSIQDQADKFSSTYRKTFISIAFFLIPFTFFLIISAKPLTLFLLTEKWESSVPFLQLLYFDGFFFPFMLLNMNVLNAIGKSKTSLTIDTIKKVFVIAGLFIVFSMGIKALIISQVFSTFIGLSISIFYIKKSIVYKSLIKDIAVVVMLTFVVGGMAYYISNVFRSNLLILIVQAVFFLMYFILSRLLHTEGYKNTISIFLHKIPSRYQKYF